MSYTKPPVQSPSNHQLNGLMDFQTNLIKSLRFSSINFINNKYYVIESVIDTDL